MAVRCSILSGFRFLKVGRGTRGVERGPGSVRNAGGEDREARSGRRCFFRFPPPAPRSFWINNRVVLHLLNALQRLRVKAGGATETRRVSFRALGVEQIGHVYDSNSHFGISRLR